MTLDDIAHLIGLAVLCIVSVLALLSAVIRFMERYDNMRNMDKLEPRPLETYKEWRQRLQESKSPLSKDYPPHYPF